MAALDEILFHQILGCHHFYDRSTPAVGLLKDGFLHSAELVAIVGGFFWLMRLRGRGALARCRLAQHARTVAELPGECAGPEHRRHGGAVHDAPVRPDGRARRPPHTLVHFHFLAAGGLFSWSILQLETGGPHRISAPARWRFSSSPSPRTPRSPRPCTPTASCGGAFMRRGDRASGQGHVLRWRPLGAPVADRTLRRLAAERPGRRARPLPSFVERIGAVGHDRPAFDFQPFDASGAPESAASLLLDRLDIAQRAVESELGHVESHATGIIHAGARPSTRRPSSCSQTGSAAARGACARSRNAASTRPAYAMPSVSLQSPPPRPWPGFDVSSGTRNASSHDRRRRRPSRTASHARLPSPRKDFERVSASGRLGVTSRPSSGPRPRRSRPRLRTTRVTTAGLSQGRAFLPVVSRAAAAKRRVETSISAALRAKAGS